ncbi:hypothetical protein [Clostridium sp. JN-9]|uniref:hypothetical protein n=1 Tax=Clostridium sp. JN-9 TaxID=2507159 RepID=UPI000FFE0957|nr:hypothetical protein [Clostridium sp. JN-9]QAT40645.1 hypothetical protein EQM05_10415 [Clostridium sp. JN-9]
MTEKIKSCSNSNDFLMNISTAIFWGSIWGITEATLGYLLHKINFKFGWCIWFPIAFYFMDKIYRQVKKAQYILYGALITSVIKLADLFIETRVDKVINPSVSIILEAAAVFAVYKIVEKKHREIGIAAVIVMNFFWRVLYAGYLFLAPKSFLAISPLRGLNPFIHFMFIESAANIAIIMLYVVFKHKFEKESMQKGMESIRIKPIASFMTLILAVTLQLLI